MVVKISEELFTLEEKENKKPDSKNNGGGENEADRE